ncbi:MAG: NADH-quinone oxidoreductase subunit L [Candidatus Micrarchaeota archaeon]|nr:NADH-quinone oxidoreductase subunit L [Candidatus Micrarchaeota archaeon]
MTPLIILVPLLAAILAIAVDKRHDHAKYIAIAGALISLVLFPMADGGIEGITWFSIGGVQLTITTSVLPLNYLLLSLVLTIGVLILVYSAGFMDLPSEQRRYYIEMLAFEAAMLAFAMAGDFIVLFIAWEFLSLTSYLLIGFWYDRDKAISAARKTITIILIGDIALLGAMVVFQNNFHSLQFSAILGNAGTGLTVLPMLLLLVAVMAKSAQFPLQEWLPDAMEGPTPVSAFLHSTTMVKAGVFVTILLFPLFSAAGLLPVMLVIGAATVAVGIFGATRERHIKRVLAYSTVQELGLMLVAVASNALLAAIYFFFAQSFYKALLFFSAGSAMKATDKEDLSEMSGIKRNKIVYITTLFGVLALAGFVPFDGFFANIGIDSAFSMNLVAYALMSLVSIATSFYIFRWMFKQSKKANARVALNYDSVPKTMSYSMIVLAAAALVASAAFFVFPSVFSGIGGSTINANVIDAGVETALVVSGAYIGYAIYGQQKKTRLSRMEPEYMFNQVYTAVAINAAYAHVASFVEALAEGVAYVDARLNSAMDWIGHGMIRLSERMRMFASGSINAYVALFAIGVLVIVLVVVATL